MKNITQLESIQIQVRVFEAMPSNNLPDLELDELKAFRTWTRVSYIIPDKGRVIISHYFEDKTWTIIFNGLQADYSYEIEGKIKVIQVCLAVRDLLAHEQKQA